MPSWPMPLTSSAAFRRISAHTSSFIKHLNAMTLSLVMIATLWAGVLLKIEDQRLSELANASRTAESISRLFEENILRSIGEMDKSLLYLRRSLNTKNSQTTAQSLIESQDLLSVLIVQLAIIDANGMMIASNAQAKPSTPINLSDREHFRVHAKGTQDSLYISAPLIGRASKAWSVQLTRRINNPDGTFGGVVVASFNPNHFNHFYGKLNLWKTANYSIIGHDGIVRATNGIGEVGQYSLGQNLIDTEIMRQISALKEGNATYVRTPRGETTPRITTVRNVSGYQLAVSVTIAESEVLAQSRVDAKKAIVVGLLLSLLVAAAALHIRRTEQRAARKSEQLQLTLDHMSQGIIMVTQDLEVPIINKKFVELLEVSEDFLISTPKFDKLVQYQLEQGEFSNTPIPEGVSVESHFGPENIRENISVYERQRPNGSVLEVRTVKTNDNGFVRTFTDVTQRHLAQSRVTRLANEDALTGLANRRVLHNSVEELCDRTRSEASTEAAATSFAVLCLDLDRFKIVNDTLGHPTGDLLLQAVAKRLKSSTRTTDILARCGGDEFAVILAGGADASISEIVARRLVDALARPYEINGHQVLISASIGIALFPQDGKNVDDIMVAADLALYTAKAQGRNAYCFFQKQMNDEVRLRRQTEMELRDAIRNSELELHYQPIIALDRDAITGFEALIRWNHPTRGMVSPADFIPIAEDSGLIIPLGEWALQEACRQAMEWPENIKVAVNLSPIQFTTKDLVKSIERVLIETGLNAERLELEITERILIHDHESTLLILHAIRNLGVQVSMDDFGTGYSSLSYLQSFPFSKIKIDRAFVSRLGTTNDAGVIVRSVIEIAKSLGMKTTAEGVETNSQHDCLNALDCDEAQGYLYSRPVPAMRIAELLATWKVPRSIAA